MTANAEELELRNRLSLIETMIAEGRRSTESYGWTFVLWGVAYYVAIAWSTLGHYGQAWPITMSCAGLLMGIIVWRRQVNSGRRPVTTIARAIWSIWIGVAISMFVLLDAIGFSGRLTDWRIFSAIVATLIGTANAASSLALKWKLQFACAVVWWATSVVCCFGTEKQSSIAFLTALFLCQIVFGIYLMIGEARVRRQEATHA
ncbi:MAG: hypothetical protein ABR906_04235 [Terracidiphilus sp.]|jgi:hypothetical protein